MSAVKARWVSAMKKALRKNEDEPCWRGRTMLCGEPSVKLGLCRDHLDEARSWS